MGSTMNNRSTLFLFFFPPSFSSLSVARLVLLAKSTRTRNTRALHHRDMNHISNDEMLVRDYVFHSLIVIAEEVKGGGRRSSRKLRDHEAKEGLVTEDKVKKTEGSAGSEARRRGARR
jgi:hypothetical protein